MIKYFLFLSALILSVSVFAKGWNQSDDQDCAIDKTPLTRCLEFDSFIKADKSLNSTYKSLSKKIDKEKLNTLKSVQRDWIKWRDEKCDDAQDAIPCNNGACAGVEHDNCIITLTEQRTEELKRFEQSKNEKDFSFVKEYKQK